MPETIDTEPKLLLPGLKPFYDVAIPLAWPIIRIAVGWNLLVHGWGKVARVETRGRVSGRPVTVAIGYVDEPGGSILVAAGAPDAGWARNLEVDPDCTVTIGEATWGARAEPLAPPDAARAVALIGARTVIPVHYATFPILAGTPTELAEATSAEVVALEPGESWEA